MLLRYLATSSNRHQRVVGMRRIVPGSFVVWVLLWFLPVVSSRAQVYEAMQPGLFHLGNAWQFQSRAVSGGGTIDFTMIWAMVGTQRVGGYDTVVLREDTSPYYILDMYAYFDQVAMTLPQTIETQFNPTQHIVSVYSDPVEKIPHFVNASDSGRLFGHGQSVSYVEENPSIWETRTEDQRVTFIGNQVLTVPYGTFWVTVLRVDESWRINDGRWGLAQRFFYMNHTLGPVALDYAVWNYDAYGNLVSTAAVSHRLIGFASGTPELFADQLSFSPGAAMVGQNLTVNWREGCQFRPATVAHHSDIYLTTDTLITSNDFRIGGLDIPAMAANGIYNASITGAVPAQVPEGQYHVGVLVDTANAVDELDEGNNVFVSTDVVTVTAQPDLTVTDVAFSPDVVAPGETIHVTGTVRNIGGGRAAIPTWAHIYLSTDNIIDVNDFPLVTGLQIPPLGPSDISQITQIAMIPPQFACRPYYVGIIADVNNALAESNEDNNAGMAAQPLVVGRPDLQVVSGGFSPSSAWVGQQVTLQAIVRNTGAMSAGESWTHVYLSADTAITTNDILVQGALYCPPLAPDDGITVNVAPFIPPVPRAGTYYLGVYVDVNNQVVESNEANNGKVFGPILVKTSPPDLFAQSFNVGPRVLKTGDPVAITGSIVNGGGAPTTSSVWVEFFVSHNANLAPPRYFLCTSLRLPALSIGGRYSLSAMSGLTVSSGIPPGEYTVGVIIDRTNEVAESNKANNTTVLTEGKLYLNGARPAQVSRWQMYR